MAKQQQPTPTSLQVYSQPVSTFTYDPVIQEAEQATPIPQEVAGESGPGAYGQDVYEGIQNLIGAAGDVGARAINVKTQEENRQQALEGQAKRWQLQKSYAKAWADGDITADMNPYFLIAYEEADADLAYNQFVGNFEAERERLINSGDKNILLPGGYDALFERMRGEFLAEYNGSDSANATLMESPYWGNTFSGSLEQWKAKNQGRAETEAGDIRVKRILDAAKVDAQGLIHDYTQDIARIRSIAAEQRLRGGPALIVEEEAIDTKTTLLREELLNRMKRLPNIVWNEEANKTILDGMMEAVLSGGEDSQLILDFVENDLVYGHEAIGYGNLLSQWTPEGSESSYWAGLKGKYKDRLDRALAVDIEAEHVRWDTDSGDFARDAAGAGTFESVREFRDFIRNADNPNSWRNRLSKSRLTGLQQKAILRDMESAYKSALDTRNQTNYRENVAGLESRVRNRMAATYTSQLPLTEVTTLEMAEDVRSMLAEENPIVASDGIAYQPVLVQDKSDKYQIKIGNETLREVNFEDARKAAVLRIHDEYHTARSANGGQEVGKYTAMAMTYDAKGVVHPDLVTGIESAANMFTSDQLANAVNDREAHALRLAQVRDAVKAVDWLDRFDDPAWAGEVEGIHAEDLVVLRAIRHQLDSNKEAHIPSNDLMNQVTDQEIHNAYAAVAERKDRLRAAGLYAREYISDLRGRAYTEMLNIEVGNIPSNALIRILQGRKNKQDALDMFSPGTTNELIDHLLVVGVMNGSVKLDDVRIRSGGRDT